MLLGLAVDTAVGQQIGAGKFLIAVKQSMCHDLVPFEIHGGNAVGQFLELFRVGHAVAGDAHRIDLFPVETMLGQQLVEAVGIAGLEEDQHLFFGLSGLLQQILGEVGTAEIVPHEAVVHLVHGGEHAGGHVVAELALFPAQHPINDAFFKQFGGFCNKSFPRYFLHLRSSSLLFSPRAATVLAKSFMVAANFAPSAALTHSTRVRSRSMPR